jgi:hypothetical protein
MNIVIRYQRRLDPHDTLQYYFLLRANKYIPIVTLGWTNEKKSKWIPGVFKYQRVRRALKINKKTWKRLTEGKTAFNSQQEIVEIIDRINYHLANKLKEEHLC